MLGAHKISSTPGSVFIVSGQQTTWCTVHTSLAHVMEVCFVLTPVVIIMCSWLTYNMIATQVQHGI